MDNSLSAVKELLFENRPVHVFEHNGKIAFVAHEVGTILGIVNVRDRIRDSKTLEESIDYDVIPGNLLPECRKNRHSSANRTFVLYQSGFFLFVLRSNKPAAVPFTRWAIREAIPTALQQMPAPAFEFKSSEVIKMMELAARYNCPYSRQKLENMGFKPAPPKNRQLDFSDAPGISAESGKRGGGNEI